MAECPVPLRDGDTLGDYYWGYLDMLEALKECNRLQAQERAYYLSD